MHDFKTMKKRAKTVDNSLREIRVALLGDSATQFLAVSIIGENVIRSETIRNSDNKGLDTKNGNKSGIKPDWPVVFGQSGGVRFNLFEAEYNQIERQIFDLTSDYHKHNAEYTIIFQSTHKLLEQYSLRPSDTWKKIAEERLDFIKSLCGVIKGKIIYFNYPEIEDGVFGSYANKFSGSFTYQIRKLNYGIMNLAQEYPNLLICDLASIQNKIGRNTMFNSAVYVNTEMLLSMEALPYVASRVIDIIYAVEGQIKKCLILDLDNTLWGGVVGDEGWENIQIGHGLGIGRVYTEIQEWVKKLKNRGIIICVCSKNDEDKAKEPFEKNPEMVLKLEDISVFIANWDNKADNIRIIQNILNIGFDSMVFFDDNPFERNLVRESIPEVSVPELPDEPENWLEFMYDENLFETASHSMNDKERTRQYQVETKRVAVARSFINESDFLKSLEMVSEVSGFTRFNTPRVAQLSQRSNQFNLRTVRYTEDQITVIENNPQWKGFSFTLEDKFGDNGLIAVVILADCSGNIENIPENLRNKSSTFFIDTWFMSCRILKRGLENFILNTIVSWVRDNGYKRIVGEYLPTVKNGMVAEHYPNLGFQKIENVDTAQWELEVEKYQEKECWIRNKENRS